MDAKDLVLTSFKEGDYFLGGWIVRNKYAIIMQLTIGDKKQWNYALVSYDRDQATGAKSGPIISYYHQSRPKIKEELAKETIFVALSETVRAVSDVHSHIHKFVGQTDDFDLASGVIKDMLVIVAKWVNNEYSE